MKQISEESRERRDNKERRELWEISGSEGRCIGGHLTHSGYVCPWCHSDDPGSYCEKEKVGRPDD